MNNKEVLLPQDNKAVINRLHCDLEKQLSPTLSSMFYTVLRENGAKEIAEAIDKLIFAYIISSKENIEEYDKEIIFQVKQIRDMFIDIEKEITIHLLARIKE